MYRRRLVHRVRTWPTFLLSNAEINSSLLSFGPSSKGRVQEGKLNESIALQLLDTVHICLGWHAVQMSS